MQEITEKILNSLKKGFYGIYNKKNNKLVDVVTKDSYRTMNRGGFTVMSNDLIYTSKDLIDYSFWGERPTKFYIKQLS